MRNSLFAAAVAVCALLPTAALSEGLPEAFTPVAYPSEPAFTYKGGPYIGLTAGYAAAAFDAEGVDLGDQAAMGGAYLGWTFVDNGWAYGIEGDYVLTDVTAGLTDTTFTFQSKTDYLASIRGRAGLTVGPMLFYGTGGIAFTEAKVKVSDGLVSDSDSKQLLGWVLGAGVEAELTRTVSVRVEGLHYNFSDETFSFSGGDVDASADQSVIRAGVSFKLN